MQSLQWRPGRLLLTLLTLSWLGAVGGGQIALWNYASTPGQAGDTPSWWPEKSNLSRRHGRLTLLMFAHPKCPCTRASLDELARLMAQCGDRVTAHVLFYKPSASASDWEETELWHAAEAIPGVRVEVDLDHQEATKFAVAVSGDVVLYDTDGRLLFHGGITGSRGHSGDNPGRRAVVALASTGTSSVERTCVFGCSIREKSGDLAK